LSLSEDDIGLAFEVEPPDTSWVRDLLISIRRGDINQMSFGFRTIRDKWEAVGEQIVRTLIEVQLFDVSLVAFPAYTATSASVRSAYEAFLTANSNHRAGSDNPPGGGTQVQGVTSLQHLRRLLDLAELED
jgi:phage head maturation protease